MLPQSRRNLVQLSVSLWGALLIQNGICYAAQITWTNTSGGDWSDATNWSPNQVPGAGDSASITNPGNYTVALNAEAAVAGLVLGGAGFGTQTFQAGGGFALTAGSVSVNSGGVMVLTGEAVRGGTLTVASGGLLSSSSTTFDAGVTIQNGGHFLLLSSSIIGEGSPTENTNHWLWVQSGAEFYAASNATLYLYAPITNAGFANLTNSGIRLYNDGTSGYHGAVWNQPGGVLDLFNGACIFGSLGADYLVNQGTINVANGSSSISVSNLTNLGTVTTLPGTGTLRLGTLNGLGSFAGNYNAAAGSLIQFAAASNPGISPGPTLVLGGAGQYQFLSGTLTLPTDLIPGLVMTSGKLVLGPGFQGGAITNLALNGINLTNNLPITGTFAMTNGTLATTNTVTSLGVLSLMDVSMYGRLNVAAGGLLNCAGSGLEGQVTVQSGGKLLLLGPTTTWGYLLWIQTGGELDAASNATLYVRAMMTNSGLANFTNSGISALGGGAVWNYPGGVLNLISGSGISDGSLVNQGTINVANGNSTIAGLSNHGTVVTMPGTGTLRIGINGLGSLSGTYNAAAGTLIQFVAGSYPGTSPGTPLVLGGLGQYQFVSGTLTLPTDLIPGLAMTSGNLVLGPSFQGGAITNLALSGISLTNNLPISGSFAMTNGTLATTNTVTNRGALTLDDVTMYGRLNVATGGLVNCSDSTLGAQVTVQNGGKFLLWSPTTFGEAGLSANTNDWLWIQSGGELDAAYAAPLYLYTAMTNAGFANFTNYGITIYNTGASGYSGRVWNQPSGVLNLISTASIAGGFGFDYVVNQGALNCLSPNATSLINVSSLTNAGSLNALYGTLRLQIPHVVLSPSGTLGVGLSSPTVYGLIDIPGNAALGGAFAALLNDGFLPQVGASFNVVTYGSFAGAFSNTNLQSIVSATTLPGLQHAVSFGTTYSSRFMTITAQQRTEQFVFAGTNGPPGHAYVVLSSSDPALPRTAWTPVVTNYFDNNGSFIFTTNVDPATRHQFFTYRYQ